jgi:dihydroorotate dehydrogenase
MYGFLRRFLFLFDPEAVHYFSMNALKMLCAFSPFRQLLRKYFTPEDHGLKRRLFEFEFRNPVGLGAGFDKNARYIRELDLLGFGFMEIGTVTPKPQAGNDKPRLFRLPADQALINRMGFNNDGVKVVADRLRNWRKTGVGSGKAGGQLIIGGNIGKNKSTPNEEAWKDYETCFRELFDCVDYFVVNVSSPNTPGLRELQEKESLKKILSHLQTINNQQSAPKPLLLKIAPDLTAEQLTDVIELAVEIALDGLVATNTTIDRGQLKTTKEKLGQIGAGGLSGRPLVNKSTAIITDIHRKSQGSIPLIASGGIFTGRDALEKMSAGAHLIQVWTGFIYEGPSIVKNICRSLNKTTTE